MFIIGDCDIEVVKLFMSEVREKSIAASGAYHKTGGRRSNVDKASGRKRGRPRKEEYGVDPRLPGKVMVSYIH